MLEVRLMQLPEAVLQALNRLASAGFEGYVVGGAVRDLVRGVPVHDWDLTTDALPEQIEASFADCRIFETGLKHGTVTVLVDGLPLEITTYRVDGAYTDHRRPDAVRFTRSLREDLARRDFTVNAMAYSPESGLVDCFGGVRDLRAGVIRCVGDPNRRFQEDSLRILRGMRFAAVLDMRVEQETASAMERCRTLLTSVSAERIREELSKLLCGGAAAGVLAQFSRVAAAVLPELEPMFGFCQHNPHHDRDVWAHTLAVVDAVPPEPVLRWAALLHDSGKPGCFTRDEAGIGHFYGHGERSAALSETIAQRLRFDTAGREELVRLVRFHDMPLLPERKLLRRLLLRFGEKTLRRQLALHRADARGQSALSAGRLEVYDRTEALLDVLLRERACFSLRDLAVNGWDMQALGLHGKAVGMALEACLRAVVDEALPNDRQPLLEWVQSGKALILEAAPEGRND